MCVIVRNAHLSSLADGKAVTKMAVNRLERIKEEIKRELTDVIRNIKDPRVKSIMVSVVAVDVTKDLKYAKVYVSVMGSSEEKAETVKGLNSAGGFVRSEIARRLNIRNTPQFKFVLDNSVEYGIHINELIHKINEGDK